MMTGSELLEVRDLSISFRTPRGIAHAVSGSNFTIGAGERVGMVGESGSGKSLTGLSLLGLTPPAAMISGEVFLDGVDLLSLSDKELRKKRGKQVSMIFQEPMTALDPVFTVGQQIAATFRAHHGESRSVAKERSIDLLQEVGIPEPQRRYREYPHQLSGGMRQRAMIAMALVCEPQLLIADEPTTALDVTIQAQVLDLIVKLSEERGAAVLLITHDLGVIAETCDRVLTMYAGQVVEQCSVDDALERPQHPYTSGLLSAIPRPGVAAEDLHSIPGRVPQPVDFPSGCRFGPRCEHRQEMCAEPQELLPAGLNRLVRCARHGDLALPSAIPPSLQAD
ncbi:MAG: peptide/nickel transport system ATP-binding protein [Candidatus Poriferisodalaceae bacterium]|jgi:peptide/nickel transport system ATP-binding protein